MRTILLTIIGFCLLGQDLPVASQRALALMEREIAVAREKAIRAMDADLQRAMKATNLEQANAINAEIERQRAFLPAPGQAPGMPAAMERMSGRRVVSGHSFDRWMFSADGTVTGPGFTGGPGTWEYHPDRKLIIIKTPRWYRELAYVSDDVWMEGTKAWTLQK